MKFEVKSMHSPSCILRRSRLVSQRFFLSFFLVACLARPALCASDPLDDVSSSLGTHGDGPVYHEAASDTHFQGKRTTAANDSQIEASLMHWISTQDGENDTISIAPDNIPWGLRQEVFSPLTCKTENVTLAEYMGQLSAATHDQLLAYAQFLPEAVSTQTNKMISLLKLSNATLPSASEQCVSPPHNGSSPKFVRRHGGTCAVHGHSHGHDDGTEEDSGAVVSRWFLRSSVTRGGIIPTSFLMALSFTNLFSVALITGNPQYFIEQGGEHSAWAILSTTTAMSIAILFYYSFVIKLLTLHFSREISQDLAYVRRLLKVLYDMVFRVRDVARGSVSNRYRLLSDDGEAPSGPNPDIEMGDWEQESVVGHYENEIGEVEMASKQPSDLPSSSRLYASKSEPALGDYLEAAPKLFAVPEECGSSCDQGAFAVSLSTNGSRAANDRLRKRDNEGEGAGSHLMGDIYSKGTFQLMQKLGENARVKKGAAGEERIEAFLGNGMYLSLPTSGMGIK